VGEAGAEAEAEAETVLAGGVKIHTESMEMGPVPVVMRGGQGAPLPTGYSRGPPRTRGSGAGYASHA
jgi:hypothetical protein